MADITREMGGALPLDMRTTYKDMEDGTHAIVRAIATPGSANVNTNIQVGDVDVGNDNPVPVSGVDGALTVDQAVHDNLNANANIQVGDVDVGNDNPVPVSGVDGALTVDQAVHDNLNANANIQVGDADVAVGNPVPVQANDISLRIVQTPTITAGLYASGDALGGLLTFADAARLAGGTGIITKVVIVDDDQEIAPIDIVFFDQTFTATADNAPFDPSDADMQNCIGFIDVAATDYADFVDNSVAAKGSGLRMPFAFDLVGTSLFAQLVVRATPTYTATDDITVKLTISRN